VRDGAAASELKHREQQAEREAKRQASEHAAGALLAEQRAKDLAEELARATGDASAALEASWAAKVKKLGSRAGFAGHRRARCGNNTQKATAIARAHQCHTMYYVARVLSI
jgi:hypothetical protein